ncbi:MAG: hypothetical protein MAG471_00365 [Acidimicrobiaceae bacterium]|nr:hypothetical protein [Acidimicrobiaceae bacterium]
MRSLTGRRFARYSDPTDLDNLIDNAVAVAPPGSTVTVSIERDADSHVLAVSDSGPG